MLSWRGYGEITGDKQAPGRNAQTMETRPHDQHVHPSIDELRLSQPRDSSTYLAFRTIQGGRVVYSTRVPLMDLPTILPTPDPNVIDPDNRKVDRLHSKHFGEYIDSEGWVAPALMARDSGGC